jgi:hypothetical protein
MRRYLALIVLCFSMIGCSNKLSGTLTVDKKPFAPDSCRSGQIYGFAGVEVTSKQGSRIRVVLQPTGQGNLVFFPPGAQVGKQLGPCGVVSVTPQKSTVNDVRNVEGKVDLSCEANGHSVKGTLIFSNCH